VAPWGDPLQAAWALVENPSHGEGESHGDGRDHDHHTDEAGDQGSGAAQDATDPVCGMLVSVETASAKGLTSHYRGVDYYFCGKGCKLDFEEDPERYLNPSYAPSM
jgi:Cu+-exporting ATPase